MSALILSKEELEALLSKLNSWDFYEKAKSMSKKNRVVAIASEILSVYKNQQNKIKKHYYADISTYVFDTNAEVNFLVQNLELLISNAIEIGDDELIIIAHKLREHIEIELTRFNQRKLIENTMKYSGNKTVDEIEQIKEDAIKHVKQTNIDIKTIQGNIMKEAVAITSIIVAIIGFLLTNAGILTAISGDSLFDRSDGILRVLIQVNASMALGISVLMMIAAAFIHKRSSDDECFVLTAKFIVPAIITIIAIITLILTNK